MQTVHIGTVEVREGVPRFIPDNKAFLQMDLEGFIGARIECRFEKLKRSTEFNAYYFVGCVKVFVDHWNKENTFSRLVDIDWVHELLAAKFLGFTRQVLPFGEIIEMRNRSSVLSTSEFANYVENVRAWGIEFFGLTFPDKPKS